MSEKPTKEIVVNNGDLTLTVTSVNQAFLRELLLEMGDPEKIISEGLANIQIEAKVSAVKGASNYLNYCMAMGVINDPPDNLDDSVLAPFMSDTAKAATANPNIRRANWLRYHINNGEGLSPNDQSTIVAEITALTFNTSAGGNKAKKPKAKKPKRSYTS